MYFVNRQLTHYQSLLTYRRHDASFRKLHVFYSILHTVGPYSTLTPFNAFLFNEGDVKSLQLIFVGLAYIVMTFRGPKNQSFEINCDPDKFQYTCTVQWATAFRKFWLNRPLEQNGGSDESRDAGFFLLAKRLSNNFGTADFHPTWPRNMNPCRIKDFGNKFTNIPPPAKKPKI